MELVDRDRPQIIYALVMRGPKVVLAEYTPLAGNFQQATIQVLQKLEHTVEGKSYIYGEYAFHYTIDQSSGLWFVCMAEQAMGRRIPFGFLGALSEAFKQRYTAEEVESAIAYGMQGTFKEQLKLLIERYNSPDVDRVTAIREKMKDINDTLMESIDKILHRQEQIELLVNRSQLLSESSGTFRREAQTLRRTVWWRNARTWAILLLIAVLVIVFVVMLECGVKFDQCSR